MTQPPPFQQKSLRTWLFNPFYYVAGGKALVIGLCIILAASLLASISNSHFDGVLDFHSGFKAPVWAPIIEGLFNWLCLSVFLYMMGLILVGFRARAIDVFGTQALARWPTLGMALIALIPAFQRATAAIAANPDPQAIANIPPGDMAILAIAGFLILPLVIWMVALMYRAYAVSCNIKGAKAIVTFIIALFLAEAASKIVFLIFQSWLHQVAESQLSKL